MLIIYKELHRDVRCHLTYSMYIPGMIYINDLIVAVKAARQGVTVGEDTASELMFADDFVGISETPEALQKQLEKVLEYTRKWRVTVKVKKHAVVVCHEDKVNTVNFSWK